MPKTTTDNTLAFEEIPPDLRPAMVANYLRLLDEGFLAEHITFRRYGTVLRAVATFPNGREGTSRPACPRPAPAPEQAINPDSLDREKRNALQAERTAQLAALEGTRVRASWPGGHERIGVVTRRDRFTFTLSEIESVLLRPSDHFPALDPFTVAAVDAAPLSGEAA